MEILRPFQSMLNASSIWCITSVYGHLATNEIATKKSTLNSAIIYTVYVPGIVTSSSNQNISLSILIATLRRTSNLFASLERCHLFKIQQPFLRNTT